jgi:hypothetical protein
MYGDQVAKPLILLAIPVPPGAKPLKSLAVTICYNFSLAMAGQGRLLIRLPGGVMLAW